MLKKKKKSRNDPGNIHFLLLYSMYIYILRWDNQPHCISKCVNLLFRKKKSGLDVN